MNREEKRMKPKASTPVDVEYTGLGTEAGDRIAEKLSISVPTQPLLRPTGLGRYFGQNVRVLLNDGSEMTGFLQGRQFNYLHFLNIDEACKDRRTTAAWCGIKIDSVSRIYPGNVKVEKISKP